MVKFVLSFWTIMGAKHVATVATANKRASNAGPKYGSKAPRPAWSGNIGRIAAEHVAWPNNIAAQCLKTAFLGGLGPEDAVLTAAISLRTDDAPADELIDSRRLHDNADVLADRHDIGEYVAMCCKHINKINLSFLFINILTITFIYYYFINY